MMVTHPPEFNVPPAEVVQVCMSSHSWWPKNNNTYSPKSLKPQSKYALKSIDSQHGNFWFLALCLMLDLITLILFWCVCWLLIIFFSCVVKSGFRHSKVWVMGRDYWEIFSGYPWPKLEFHLAPLFLSWLRTCWLVFPHAVSLAFLSRTTIKIITSTLHIKDPFHCFCKFHAARSSLTSQQPSEQ